MVLLVPVLVPAAADVVVVVAVVGDVVLTSSYSFWVGPHSHWNDAVTTAASVAAVDVAAADGMVMDDSYQIDNDDDDDDNENVVQCDRVTVRYDILEHHFAMVVRIRIMNLHYYW